MRIVTVEMCKKQKTTEQFVAEAKIKYGNKYDYSKTKYTSAHGPIIITCTIHKCEFEKKAYSFLQGHGCPECAGKGKITTEIFIQRSRRKHGNKYDYSKSVYTGADDKIIITCPTHGDFTQRAIGHSNNGYGCPKCKADTVGNVCRDTIPGFITKATKVHGNKYDYSTITNYVNRMTPIRIKCKKHNWIFKQRPGDHLAGNGCRKCAYAGYSRTSINWLNSVAKKEEIFIRHAENKGEHKVRYKYKGELKWICVDGYHKESRTVYEFHGCYHHGHPPGKCKRVKKNKFEPNDINPSRKVSYAQLYKDSMKREKILKALGYKVITVWECEFLDI